MRLVVGWVVLVVLAALNLGLSQIGLGPWSLAGPLMIGAVMASIVALLFMRLNSGIAISRIFAVSGLFWLAIMFALSGADYFTRIVYPVMQP